MVWVPDGPFCKIYEAHSSGQQKEGFLLKSDYCRLGSSRRWRYKAQNNTCSGKIEYGPTTDYDDDHICESRLFTVEAIPLGWEQLIMEDLVLEDILTAQDNTAKYNQDIKNPHIKIYWMAFSQCIPHTAIICPTPLC